MSELDEIRRLHSPVAEVHLRFLDVPFTVRSNSQDLARMIRAYYSNWLAPDMQPSHNIVYAYQGQGIYDRQRLQDLPRHEGKRVKEAFYDGESGRVILKKRTGATVYVQGNERYVVGNLLLHLHQLVNVINEAFEQIVMARGYALVHASGVVIHEGYGVMITSASGLGKSTVALALMERGFKFLSNDRVLIKSDGGYVHMIGVPKKPRVNPGTVLALESLSSIIPPEEREMYAGMEVHELWELEHKFDVDIDRIYGPGTFELESMLREIYILNWQRQEGRTCIALCTPDTGNDLLIPQVLNLNSERRQYEFREYIEEEVKEICQQTPIYNVTGSVDIHYLADQISKKHKAPCKELQPGPGEQ